MKSLQKTLEKNLYKVSTDTRKDLRGSVYFALKGPTFDGNKFAKEALKKGAVAVVSDNSKNAGEKVYIVKDALTTLQEVARNYRQTFKIPIIAIGGSNGKTTSKELLNVVLKTKYKTHATIGSLNNHIGVPLSILSMNKKTEIAIFELGANHPKEHLELLKILKPTHVVVTNNGMDHLDGFGSPEGARKANKEIYDWAKVNKSSVFVNKNHPDLMEDSKKNIRIIYPDYNLLVSSNNPLTLKLNNKNYETKLSGRYNLENIELAVKIGEYFGVKKETALKSIGLYKPSLKRSQFLRKNGINFIVDCYNANPTSMKLSLGSFLSSVNKPRGVVLGDMSELGKFTPIEHKKVVDFIFSQNIDCPVFIGKYFKKSLKKIKKKYYWFLDSEEARVWFWSNKFKGYTFLLKGSRGLKIEKIIE